MGRGELPEDDLSVSAAPRVFCLDNAATFVKTFHEAQGLAARHGWEGDFREPARVLWLPEEGSPAFTHAFVWKQDHNGTTTWSHRIPCLGSGNPQLPENLGDSFQS